MQIYVVLYSREQLIGMSFRLILEHVTWILLYALLKRDGDKHAHKR